MVGGCKTGLKAKHSQHIFTDGDSITSGAHSIVCEDASLDTDVGIESMVEGCTTLIYTYIGIR
jgi:hypothetical protein